QDKTASFCFDFFGIEGVWNQSRDGCHLLSESWIDKKGEESQKIVGQFEFARATLRLRDVVNLTTIEIRSAEPHHFGFVLLLFTNQSSSRISGPNRHRLRHRNPWQAASL